MSVITGMLLQLIWQTQTQSSSSGRLIVPCGDLECRIPGGLAIRTQFFWSFISEQWETPVCPSHSEILFCPRSWIKCWAFAILDLLPAPPMLMAASLRASQALTIAPGTKSYSPSWCWQGHNQRQQPQPVPTHLLGRLPVCRDSVRISNDFQTRH